MDICPQYKVCITTSLMYYIVLSCPTMEVRTHRNSLTAHNWQKWKKSIPDMSLPWNL